MRWVFAGRLLASAPATLDLFSHGEPDIDAVEQPEHGYHHPARECVATQRPHIYGGNMPVAIANQTSSVKGPGGPSTSVPGALRQREETTMDGPVEIAVWHVSVRRPESGG